jgi:hypothetical protein
MTKDDQFRHADPHQSEAPVNKKEAWAELLLAHYAEVWGESFDPEDPTSVIALLEILESELDVPIRTVVAEVAR